MKILNHIGLIKAILKTKLTDRKGLVWSKVFNFNDYFVISLILGPKSSDPYNSRIKILIIQILLGLSISTG